MATTHPVASGKGPVIASWILRVLLASAFLAAAGSKLAGVPMMVELFAQIGLGDWFRYVTAFVEIAGAVGLFIPGVTALAALWLGGTMLVALLVHLFILHTSPAGAIVLLVLLLVLAWLQRAQLARFH